MQDSDERPLKLIADAMSGSCSSLCRSDSYRAHHLFSTYRDLQLNPREFRRNLSQQSAGQIAESNPPCGFERA
jgi:hypothetical protein